MSSVDTLRARHRAAFERRLAIAQSGTNVSNMIGRFREELKKDTAAHSFNDDFADSISELMRRCNRTAWSRLLVAYAVSFLLIISLLDYEMPLSLPYLSQTTTKGLLDIAVVVFLVNVYSILEIKRQAHLCKAMLRTYCEERYLREHQVFILLKWGVDLLCDKVTRGTYGSSKVWHPVWLGQMS